MTESIQQVLADDQSFDPDRHVESVSFEEAGVKYNIEASGPRYLIVVKSAPGKHGNIVIPDTYRPKETVGWIVDVGDGTLDHETGRRVPPRFGVGDLVMFGHHAGTKVDLGGREYRLMQYDSVLGRLTPVDNPHEDQE